jgi:hypothetical protein
MKFLKKFENWNPINIIIDKGDFHIIYEVDGEEKEEVVKGTDRRKLIKGILANHPKAKIKKIEHLGKSGEPDDIDPEYIEDI